MKNELQVGDLVKAEWRGWPALRGSVGVVRAVLTTVCIVDWPNRKGVHCLKIELIKVQKGYYDQ